MRVLPFEVPFFIGVTRVPLFQYRRARPGGPIGDPIDVVNDELVVVCFPQACDIKVDGLKSTYV